MRLSTANYYAGTVSELMDRQSQLADTQTQMTSGKRVNRSSDDPAAAARSERAQAAEARTVATQRAVDASNSAMTLSESAIGDAGSLLQDARDALVAAGNAGYGDSDRASLAEQLSGIRQQLLGVANRTDGAGNYLFGGQSSTLAPFADLPGGVRFQGSAGASKAAGTDGLPLSVDGKTAWMTARTGNGSFTTSATIATGSAWIDAGAVTDPSALTGANYSVQFSVAGGATTYSILKNGTATAQTGVAFKSGDSVQIDGMSAAISGAPANGDTFAFGPSTASLSVFDTLDKAIAGLKTPNRTGAQRAQSVNADLAGLDAVTGQLASARSQLGSTLKRVDTITGRLADLKLSSQTERSHAEDIDMTEAISSFANQQTGYDAALKAYSTIQRLSLFNYIGS